MGNLFSKNSIKAEGKVNIGQNIAIKEKKENIIIEEEDKPLCMKIYLCGNGKGREPLIRKAFKDITDEYFKTQADREFKTDQFHWILKVFTCESLNDGTCRKIVDDIELSRNEEINENNKNILNQNVIICFGDNKLLENY